MLFKNAMGFALAASVLGLASTATAAPRKATNGELRVGTIQEVDNLNPVIGSMSASSYIRDMAQRAVLAYMNEDNKWTPADAVRIPSMENGDAKFFEEGGKKKLRVNWEIRKDAKWGDGAPVTGEDYKFGWEVSLNDNVGYAGDREARQAIERFEIDAKNPKKFSLVYKTPRWDYFTGQTALPYHLDGAIYNQTKSQPQAYEKQSKYSTEPTNPGLWYGPYRVSEYRQGSHITLIPNANWGGAKPKIKKIIVKLIPSTATLEANLLSGELDYTNQQGFTFDQGVEFAKKIKSDNLPFEVIFEQSLTYEHVDVNLDNPLLKDVRVRKAMMYAMNREELVKALFDGKQKVAHNSLNPADPWYSETAGTKYLYSQRKADKLLEEAGWKKGADGFRTKDGKKLTVKFSTTSGNKSRENVQVYLKDQLKKAGIDVTIKNEPAKVFFDETMRKRSFDLGMYAWSSSPESPMKPQFHSINIPTEKNGWSGQNYPGWKNAKIDALCDQMDGEFDPAKRKLLAAEVIKYYTDELPVFPLYYRANVVVVPSNLSGFKVPMTQYSEGWAAEKWNLK